MPSSPPMRVRRLLLLVLPALAGAPVARPALRPADGTRRARALRRLWRAAEAIGSVVRGSRLDRFPGTSENPVVATALTFAAVGSVGGSVTGYPWP